MMSQLPTSGFKTEEFWACKLPIRLMLSGEIHGLCRLSTLGANTRIQTLLSDAVCVLDRPVFSDVTRIREVSERLLGNGNPSPCNNMACWVSKNRDNFLAFNHY